MTDYSSLPAFKIWKAGVDSVKAESLVANEVRVGEANELIICGKSYSLDKVQKLCVVGAGKAAGYFAKSIEDLLRPLTSQLKLFGHVNVPANCVVPTEFIKLHAARPAGVNEPRAEGVIGAKAIQQLVSSLDENDLCLCLITGGGSALLPLPAAGVTLEEKLLVTKLMSSRGASIHELNRVRIALSQIKGGGLARACSANRLVTLIVSDVIGDPLDLIASGPTVEPIEGPETLKPIEILAKYAKRSELPESLWQFVKDTDKANQPK